MLLPFPLGWRITEDNCQNKKQKTKLPQTLQPILQVVGPQEAHVSLAAGSGLPPIGLRSLVILYQIPDLSLSLEG